MHVWIVTILITTMQHCVLAADQNKAIPRDDKPKVLIMVSVIWVHAGFIHHLLYVHSTRSLEFTMSSVPMMVVRNGSALMQIYITLSSFLLSYNLLQLAQLKASLLPRLLLLRYIRLSPVNLLIVGFAATWWSELRDGPMWRLAVDAEAAVCRRKFWTQALYVHNLVDNKDHCLVQTWSLAADMQLFLVAAVLTLALHRSLRAVRILTVLFLASCLLNGVLAYSFHLKTLLYIMIPKNLRTMFRDEPSFGWFYMSPWGSLPACLLGLIMAHVHYDKNHRNIPFTGFECLRWMFRLYPPLAMSWILNGIWLIQHDSRLAVAIHAAVERPVLNLLTAAMVFWLLNKYGIERDILAHSAWRVLSRLSLPALLLHWPVNMLLVAAHPFPIPTSQLDVFSDFLLTWCVTYLLAVPVSLLVEQPIQRFTSALIS